MKKFTDVRTQSIPTAAILTLLGHEPLEITRNALGAPTIHFDLSAEADLHRYHDAKRRIERQIQVAEDDAGGDAR